MSANPSSASRPKGGRGAEESVSPHRRIRRVLVTIHGPAANSVLDLGVNVATDTGAELFVLYPVALPEQTPHVADTPRREAQHVTAKQQYRLETDDDVAIPVEGVVRLSRTELDALESAVEDYDITTVLRERMTSGSVLSTARRALTDWRSPVYDTIVAHGLAELDTLDRLLVPISGGPHSGFAVDVAASLARQNDAWVDLLHVVPDAASASRRRSAEELLSTALDRVEGYERADTWLHEADDASDAIVSQSGEYNLTVLGAPQKGKLRQFVFGSITGVVREDSDSAVLTVHHGTSDSWTDKWFGRGT